MVALDVGRLAFWLSVSLVASLAALGAAIGCGLAAASLFRSRGRSPRAGFWLGFGLLPVGVAVAALLPGRLDHAPTGTTIPTRRTLTRLAVGVGAAALVVPVAAIVVYTQFINDPEPRLDTNDLADLVGGADAATTSAAGAVAIDLAGFSSPDGAEPTDSTTESSDAASSTECVAESATDTSAAAETSAPADGAAEGFDGEWAATGESEFGYRVPEVLAGVETEAVGRGSDIAGSFTVAGNEVIEACFVVQVASITSDETLRDGQFNGRIMETDAFPTATFVLTEPIVLDELPAVGGDAVTATATGDLTLHGVTNSVTFEVTVQAGDGIVGVLGSIPIAFADYGIADPSGGPAQVGDDGELEFLLAFEPA
jgi:polyisoprenoid-binding protein YceI